MSCPQNIVFVISYTFLLFLLPKCCLFMIETKNKTRLFLLWLFKRHGQFRSMRAELKIKLANERRGSHLLGQSQSS